MKNETGSIAPLIAGYLALIILVMLGSASVGVMMIASNRVQAVTDAALLFGHDRSVSRGAPDQKTLQRKITEFLERAPSANRIEVSLAESFVAGKISGLKLCANVENPLIPGSKLELCKTTRAESFEIP